MTAISREQIIAKNAITDPTKETEEWNKALDITEEHFKNLLKLSEKKMKFFDPDTAEKIEEFNEELKESKKIVKDLDDLQKERIKTQKDLDKAEKKRLETIEKLKFASTEEAQALAAINLQLQEQNKANKESAKSRLGLISAYAKESKRLNDLRNEYKDLAVQNKENTKEGKLLLKNIVTLDKKLKDLDDSVGQNFRSVGKYEKALKGLNSIIGKLGALALLTKGVELLAGAFENSREGALETNKVLANFIQTAQVLINNFIKSFSGIKDVFNGIVLFFEAKKQFIENLVFDFAATVSEAFLEIALSAAEVNLALSVWPASIKKAEGAIILIQGKIDNLAKVVKNNAKQTVSFADAWDLVAQGGEKVATAFDNTGKTVLKAIKGQQEFLELELKLKVAIEQQTRALAGLQEQRQILQDISDDDTIGFVTRAKAIKKAEKAAEDFAKKDVALAKLKEKLTIEAVKQDLRANDALTERRLAEIITGEQLKAVLLEANIGRKISDANDEAFSAAFVERREKETEALSFRRDQEEKIRKTNRDAFEQENDILVEFTEQRIAANETIINSDKATLAERRKALAENQKLEKDLFDDSIKLILEQGRVSIGILKETIDKRTDLTDLEKEAEKSLLDKRAALLTNAAIQEILNEQDIVAQGVLIRNLDLGEIEEKVLKDTLKLKQDITEANKEALIVEEEAATKTTELHQDILTQERFLNGQLIDLEAEQLDNEKIHLQERIAALKKDSVERLELEKELNGLLIEEAQKQAEKEEELRLQKIQDAQDLANEVIDISLEELAKKDQARLSALDKEITDSESLVEKLRQNAVDGSEKALAFQEAQLEKQRLARQREQERQQRRDEAIALAQTFLNQVAEQSKEDPDTAIAEAFKNTFLARAIARGLVGFYDGTDEVGSTGTESKFSNGRDGYVARLDKGEKVFNKHESAELNAMGYNKRSDVIDAVRGYEMGNTWDFMPTLQTIETDNNIDLSAVVASNEKVVQAIKNIPPAPEFDLAGANVWIENRFTAHGKEQFQIMLKHFKHK